MKVSLRVKCEVTYIADIELTNDEYVHYVNRIEDARGFEGDRIAQELIEKAGLDIGDPSDWGDLEVDTFLPYKDPPRKRKTTSKNRGTERGNR